MYTPTDVDYFEWYGAVDRITTHMSQVVNNLTGIIFKTTPPSILLKQSLAKGQFNKVSNDNQSYL